jgi:hypothetical protein
MKPTSAGISQFLKSKAKDLQALKVDETIQDNSLLQRYNLKHRLKMEF